MIALLKTRPEREARAWGPSGRYKKAREGQVYKKDRPFFRRKLYARRILFAVLYCPERPQLQSKLTLLDAFPLLSSTPSVRKSLFVSFWKPHSYLKLSAIT